MFLTLNIKIIAIMNTEEICKFFAFKTSLDMHL